MVSKRTTLALVAVLLAAIIAAHSPALGAGAAKPKAPKSKLMTDKELSYVIPHVLPECTRVALVRTKTTEVLVGFTEDSDKPVGLAAATRYIDKKRKGSMVVAVGLKGADKRKEAITRVVTLPAKGKVKGSGKYAKGRVKFLEQFDGRVVKTKLGKVDAVSGATPLCKGIRTTVNRSLRTIRAARTRSAKLKALAAKSWAVEPLANAIDEEEEDDEGHGDDDDGGHDDKDDEDEDDKNHHHGKDDD